MAKLNPEQLPASLKNGLQPIYWIAGDEPLLVQEAADLLRHNAREQGFSEREVYHTSSNFSWTDLLQSANSLSLFATRKLLEVRLHSLKIGDAGSKALQEYCAHTNPDTVMLLLSEKADRATQNSAWAKQVDATGAMVTVWPIKEQQLPRWIEQRLRSQGLKADSQAVDILANKVEGNLLAAIQEIAKLKLLATDGVIDATLMANAVTDSARFDVFGLVDKALAGKPYLAAHSLNGLQSEGTDAIVVLWALAREIRTLLALKQLQQQGQALEAQARNYGVFPQRLGLVKSALARLHAETLQQLLLQCAEIDRAVKGMSPARPWQELLDLVLQLAGQPVIKPLGTRTWA